MNDKIFLIFRIVCLCLGLLFLPDAFLPTKNSLQEVDKLVEEYRKGAHYYVVIFKTAPHQCDVDIQTLNKIKPNEILRVYRTQLWSECVRLERDDVELYYERYWRLIVLSICCVAIVIGVGRLDLRYWWRSKL